MEKETKKPNKLVTMSGTEWIRLYTACQALMAPTKFYRFTHKHCRQQIVNILGYCPKGKPGTPRYPDASDTFSKGWREGGSEAILDFLGVVYMHQRKADDSTLLAIKEGK